MVCTLNGLFQHIEKTKEDIIYHITMAYLEVGCRHSSQWRAGDHVNMERCHADVAVLVGRGGTWWAGRSGYIIITP